MIKIGEFSALTGISINMLRNYDKIGLLIPDYVDEFNGYRYYSEEQIILANRIQTLKELGFPLKEIPIISTSSDEDMRKLIENMLLEKQKEKKHIEDQIKQMNKVINELEIYRDFVFSVRLITLNPRKVISLRANISNFEEEDLLWEELQHKCMENNIKILENEYPYAITHNVDSENNIIDTEVIRIVNEIPCQTKGLEYYQLPKCETAVVSFKGNYSRISDISSYVYRYISGTGYEISSAPLRKYFVSPNDESNPNDYITEYYYPLKKI